MTAILTATFLISAAVLGLELVLMRALSIGHWHHFSYLVISTALLGFAAGGIAVTISLNFFKKHYKSILWYLALGFFLSTPAVFKICQKVPFNELLLVWDYRQVFYLFAYYLLFFIPFLCAGSFIAVVFTKFGEKAHHLYFYNMTGSGLGVAIAIGLMYTAAPERLLLVISVGGILTALTLAATQSTRRIMATLILGAACIFLFSFRGPFKLEININENKSLVYYQALPEAETIAIRYSPLGRLDFLQAPAIRCFPGLSVSYQGKLPSQKIITIDADGTTVVNSFESMEDLKCYDYTTSALAYHLSETPNVCIIGSGGGSDVCQALRLGAKKVTAVEMNRQIIELLTENKGKFASGLYNRNDVKTVIAEGRNFLQTTTDFFDIINISLLDSPNPSSAGLYALNESHLYTIEAVKKAFSKLLPQGLVCITRLLKNPPRDSLKMFATVTEALKQLGISNVNEHIIMIRDWSTATIIAPMQPFSKSQIAKARTFSSQRNFDIVCLPGIKKQEVNKFFAFEKPVYYESSIQILAGNKDFFDKYAYNIRPATDDKPYFFDFFKWKALPYLIQSIKGKWIVFSELGYLVLAATLLQAILASSIFILLPLVITKPVKSIRKGKFPVLVYFLMLGFSYMFLEMGFIQKMNLLIGHPVFGVAVTLLGFLVFSGLGAATAGCLNKKYSAMTLIISAIIVIVIIGLSEIVLTDAYFDWMVGFHRIGRICIGLGVIAPLAFFMGMPFPTAIKQINIQNHPLIPWAWGINGFASVTGAVMGTFLAISLGFTILCILALAGYVLAALVSKKLST